MADNNFTVQFGNSFCSMLRTYEYCMQSILAKYGLYPGQPQILFAIRELNTPTQNDLAQKLRISKASTGVSLRRLEAAGFVKRVRDAQDTRCIRITLTERGEDFARWCDIDFEMLFSSMLQNLDVDKRENALLIVDEMERSLRQLKTRLDS